MQTVKIVVVNHDNGNAIVQRYYIKAVSITGKVYGEAMCDSKSTLEYALAYCVMNQWAVVGFEDQEGTHW